MTFWYDPCTEFCVDLDATYDVDIDIDLEVDTCVSLDSNVDVNHDYHVDPHIDGNEATFNVDVQAFGEDTSVQLNLVVVTTEDAWSSITATGYSVVA